MDSQQVSGQESGWAFKPDGSSSPTETENVKSASPEKSGGQNEPTITWTASEFIAHHKPPSWYAALFGGLLGLTGFAYFLTRDVVSVVTILIVGVLFAILASRKPRQLSFGLNSSGVTIGDKFYPFSQFKSFDVIHEGAVGCINLLPLKRFMPELSIYYPPEEEDKIIDALSENLPHNRREEQSFDRLMKRIRF